MTLSGGIYGFLSNAYQVLIPLLVDDPLWAPSSEWFLLLSEVLIPLLVDDPLWGKSILRGV